MTLNLNVPKTKEQLSPRITVIGVGGAGGNAVNNMIQSSLEGVDFVVANTDAQALAQTLCDRTIQLGRNITQGLGAGSRPDIGRAAAEEALDDILGQLEGSNMVFVTAGMGGGTGTGAAPVIARAAREAGVLTVGVITKPFHFEGVHRMRLAEAGINELQQFVDTLIVIPNQNLFRVANEKTTFADAFKIADDVLDAGVRGVTDLMVMPGLINLDFADIRAVMTEMGKAMMGTGEAEGDNRAIEAAEAAISNPLLDDVSMKGARGVLINITGGADLTLFEVDEAANRIRDEVDPDANIIFGSTFVQNLEGRMRVSVVATGIDAMESESTKPARFSLVESQSNGFADEAEPRVPDLGAQALRTRATVAGSGGRHAVHATELNGDSAVEETSRPKPQPLSIRAGLLADDFDGAATSERSPRRGPGLIRTALRVSAPEAAPADEGTDTDEPSTETSIAREARNFENDSFIAPPPFERDAQPLYAEDSGGGETPANLRAEGGFADRRAERPLAEADAPRKKGLRLFDRVSGAARALHSASQSDNGAPTRTVGSWFDGDDAKEASRDGGRGSRTDEELRHSELGPAKPLSAGGTEEELLDIPAFLRRQAN